MQQICKALGRTVIALLLSFLMMISLFNILVISFAEERKYTDTGVHPNGVFYADQRVHGTNDYIADTIPVSKGDTVDFNLYSSLFASDGNFNIEVVLPHNSTLSSNIITAYTDAGGNNISNYKPNVNVIIESNKIKITGTVDRDCKMRNSFSVKLMSEASEGSVFNFGATYKVKDSLVGSCSLSSVIPFVESLQGKVNIVGNVDDLDFAEQDCKISVTDPDGSKRQLSVRGNGSFEVIPSDTLLWDVGDEGAKSYTYEVVQAVSSIDSKYDVNWDKTEYRVDVTLQQINVDKLSKTTRILDKSNSKQVEVVVFNNTVSDGNSEEEENNGPRQELKGTILAEGIVLSGGEFTLELAGVSAEYQESQQAQVQSIEPSQDNLFTEIEPTQPAPQSRLFKRETEPASRLLKERQIESVTIEDEPIDETFSLDDEPNPMADVKDKPPMPAGSISNVITAKTDSKGQFNFGTVEFEKAGVYTYKVRQLNTTLSGITMDNGVYNLIYNVSEDDYGNISVEKSLKLNDKDISGKAIVFKNEKKDSTSGDTKPKVSLKVYQSKTTESNMTTEPIEVKGGDKITYILKVTNTGDTDAEDVILTAKIPSGLSYVQDSVSSQGTVSNNTINWRIPKLPKGVEGTATFQVSVPSQVSTNHWDFVATYTYGNNPDNSGDTQIVSSSNTVVANNKGSSSGSIVSPDGLELILTQSVGSNTPTTEMVRVYSGNIIRYTVTATNRGTATISNISITDSLPSGLVMNNSSISPSGRYTRNSVEWDVSNLIPGASQSFTFTATVPNLSYAVSYNNKVTARPASSITAIAESNTTVAEGYMGNSNGNNDNDSNSNGNSNGMLRIKMQQASEDSRSKTTKKIEVESGDEIDYYITVENLIDEVIRDIVITDYLPSGLSIVNKSISDDGSSSKRKVIWELDRLAAGSSKTVDFSVKVPNSGDKWENYAEVEVEDSNLGYLKSNEVVAENKDGDGDGDVTIKLTQSVRGGDSSTSSKKITKGDIVVYTLAVSNRSDDDIYGVTISDYLPDELVIDKSSIGNGGSVDGNEVIWETGRLNANTRRTVTVRAAVREGSNGDVFENYGEVEWREGSNSGDRYSEQSDTLELEYTTSTSELRDQDKDDESFESLTGTSNDEGNDGDMNNSANGNLGTMTGTTSGTNNQSTGNPNAPDGSLFVEGGKIPQTGGLSEIHLWIFLLLVSGTGLILMAWSYKRSKQFI